MTQKDQSVISAVKDETRIAEEATLRSIMEKVATGVEVYMDREISPSCREAIIKEQISLTLR